MIWELPLSLSTSLSAYYLIATDKKNGTTLGYISPSLNEEALQHAIAYKLMFISW